MTRWTEEDWKRCCASTKFAKEMAVAGPFVDLHHAVRTARHIWLNLVDVNGWLEAFANHPAIGSTSPTVSQLSFFIRNCCKYSFFLFFQVYKFGEILFRWSKEEQSKAMSTATDSTMEELKEWNQKYQDKFGFVFLICASGRSTAEILSELKKRYPNRPIVELETAAHEEMKITELRIQRLFATTEVAPSIASVDPVTKAGGTPLRLRPPITTHVLDVSRGAPASGMEVVLEKWMYDTNQPHSFAERDHPGWTTLGFSETNNDGRSGQLMDILDYIEPGFYRITFNTGKYAPTGFYPYVTLVFQVRENQKMEHFHVPLLHSPFSFTTYRGS